MPMISHEKLKTNCLQAVLNLGRHQLKSNRLRIRPRTSPHCLVLLRLRRIFEGRPSPIQAIPLHASVARHYCAALIASRLGFFRVVNSQAGKSFRRVVGRESMAGRVWRQDDDQSSQFLRWSVLSPSRDVLVRLPEGDPSAMAHSSRVASSASSAKWSSN
jgi:hypothetical protein